MGGQIAVCDQPAVGPDDGFAVGGELAHVARVEEHGHRFGGRMSGQPVHRGRDDCGGRLRVLYEQPVVAAHARPDEHFVDVLGVVHRRAEIVRAPGIPIDADHHGPGSRSGHHPGPGTVLQGQRGRRGGPRRSVEVVGGRGDGEVARGRGRQQARRRVPGPSCHGGLAQGVVAGRRVAGGTRAQGKSRGHTDDGRDDAHPGPRPAHLSFPPSVAPPGQPQHRPNGPDSLGGRYSTAAARIPAPGRAVAVLTAAAVRTGRRVSAVRLRWPECQEP